MERRQDDWFSRPITIHIVYFLAAEGFPYVGLGSQKWNLTSDGTFWHIQNVATGQYLGLDIRGAIGDGTKVETVSHKFPWYLERDRNDREYILIRVPYSRYVLNLNQGSIEPGKPILFYSYGSGYEQRWVFSKDLESSVAPSLNDGAIYMISNVSFDTVIKLNADKTANASSRDPDESAKHYKAIKTSSGWAFKNVAYGRYLGIPHEVQVPSNWTQPSGTTQEFTWAVVPDSKDITMFRLWIPYSGKMIHIANDSRDHKAITLSGDSSSIPNSWWRFETVYSEARSNPTNAQVRLIQGERLPDPVA